jgi:hypothetical protein
LKSEETLIMPKSEVCHIPRNPKLGEGNELAAILACLVDPVDGLLDRELKVEPTRLGVDGGSLVLLDERGHCC